MPFRLLLILTLVMQPLAMWSAPSRSTQVVSCVQSSCCRVVETISCCGAVVREMRCGKFGGDECRCGLRQGDSEPVPPAPRPSDRGELGPIVVTPPCGVLAEPAPVRLAAVSATPAIVRSHNEARALLCVWRT